MDFWDLTKLLARRWYLAVPVLVLSLLATGATFQKVKPTYLIDAHVQMVPPVGSGAPGNGLVDIANRNPWLNLGVATLASAAMVTIQDASVLDDLKAQGYSDDFTVTLDNGNPMVTIEVTGTTAQQATSTADNLVQRFNASATSLQKAYNVSGPDLITTRRLDVGTVPKESTSNVKRAGIAVGAAGLIFAVAWTVGMDAILRRRARRKAGLNINAPDPDLIAAPSPLLAHPQPTLARPLTVELRPATTSPGDWARRASNGTTNPDRRSSQTPTVDFQAGAITHTVPASSTNGSSITDAPSDSTVVLPLSQPSARRPSGTEQ